MNEALTVLHVREGEDFSTLGVWPYKLGLGRHVEWLMDPIFERVENRATYPEFFHKVFAVPAGEDPANLDELRQMGVGVRLA